MTPLHELSAPTAEPDSVSGRGALRIAALSVVVFVAAVALAAWLLRKDTASLAGERRPVPRAPAARALGPGHPETTPVRAVAAGWERMDAARRELHSYGFRDRARGIVHVPIERAMAIVAAEGRR